MKKYFIQLLFVLSIVSSVSGQKDYRKGEIIKLNHDTINCLIDYSGDIRNSVRCFYLSDSGSVKVFNPQDIIGYRFNNGKYYVSKFFKTKGVKNQIFVEYLVKGHKNIFYFRDNKGFHFLIDYKNDTIIELPYKNELMDDDGRLYVKESRIHNGLLKSYFSDCPTLFPEIDKCTKPDFENLIKLTKEYHHLTCGDSGCVVYYKPRSSFTIIVEPFIGKVKYKNTDNYLSQYGALLYFWLPRANENLFFKTGFIFLPDTIGSKKSFRIPIQLEYLVPNKFVRLKFDCGFNYFYTNNNAINYVNYHLISKDKDNWYYQSQAMTLLLSSGALIKLTDNLYLDLNIESDILNLSYLSSIFKSLSFNSGLYIKL